MLIINAMFLRVMKSELRSAGAALAGVYEKAVLVDLVFMSSAPPSMCTLGLLALWPFLQRKFEYIGFALFTICCCVMAAVLLFFAPSRVLTCLCEREGAARVAVAAPSSSSSFAVAEPGGHREDEKKRVAPSTSSASFAVAGDHREYEKKLLVATATNESVAV
jgi:hypothetical protein